MSFCAECSRLQGILRRKGYRESCDIAECNCGDWWSHGGNAEDRLREIGELVYVNGQTALDSVRALKAENERLRAALLLVSGPNPDPKADWSSQSWAEWAMGVARRALEEKP